MATPLQELSLLIIDHRVPRKTVPHKLPFSVRSALYTTGNSYHLLWLSAVERRFQFPHGC